QSELTMTRPDHQDLNDPANMRPWRKQCSHVFTMNFCYGKGVTELQKPDTTLNLLICSRNYWLSISSVEELHLSRSLASTIRSPILRVLQKMITYGMCQRTTGYDKVQKNELWLISMFVAKHHNGYANVAWLMAKWLKRKGVGSQKDSMICYGQLITKMAKKMRLLIDEVLNSLSAPTHCKALDTTTLRELIDSEGRLIP
ncbi:hypothetical protein Tco_1269849, partial [Tanacetum coccineum]